MSARRLEGSALALRAFLAAIAASVASGLAVILDVVQDEKWLLSAIMLAGACLLVFVQAWVADRGRHRTWMRWGMLAAALAALLGIVSLWLGQGIGWDRAQYAIRSGFVSLAFAVWTAWGGVLTVSRVAGPAIAVVRWGTFGLMSFWGTVAVIACIDPDTVEQFLMLVVGQNLFARALGASAVLTLSGTVAQPILILLASRSAQSSDARLADRHLAVVLRCPRCDATPAVEANTDAVCPGCRLSIRVTVDEPRCECGFLLYRLEGASCPECGRGVPEALRWRAPVTTSQASPPSP